MSERASSKTNREIAVIHSTHLWLSQTMTWLYTQVTRTPSHICNHVVCDSIQNLDQFPFDNLISESNDGLLWYYLGSKSWKIRKWRRLYLLKKCAKLFGAHIIHSHFGDQGWFNARTASRSGLNHVVTFYGYDVSRLPHFEPVWKDRYQELFAQAQLFLCEGPHLGDCLISLGCPKEKVKVHHLGIDLDRFDFRPRVWEPGAPLKVLMAGSFVEKKGMPYAIEALGRIKGKVDLEITIIGDHNGQERSKVEKQRLLDAMDKHGLDSHIKLMGYQPYSVLLEKAYQHHIFLSPSVTASDGDTEGGAPVSIIEMAASGMPVVSSFHCDIPEVIEDGASGLLAEERNVDELEQKLSWLIANYEKWPQISNAARRHTETEFNAVVQGERLAGHYESLLV